MLHWSFQSILEARHRDEYRDIVVRFAMQLGFDRVGAITVVDHKNAETEFFSADNMPEAFSRAVKDPCNGRRDPVMQHCKYRSAPILWDQSTYLAAREIEMWEEQASFGYRTGICLALHMPGGLHFLLGVDRDQALPKDRAEVSRMLSNAQLFAVYAQESAMRVLLPTRGELEPPPRLTPQEIDCLRWTMEGKTLWEAAAILNIAESTAKLRIGTAVRKLSCVNAPQAVLKALRLGLIR